MNVQRETLFSEYRIIDESLASKIICVRVSLSLSLALSPLPPDGSECNAISGYNCQFRAPGLMPSV